MRGRSAHERRIRTHFGTSGLALKNAFVIVTLSGLLTACAVVPQQHSVAADVQAASTPAAEPLLDDEAQAARQKAEEEARLPKVELTPVMLYQLLKAEFAFRNGDWQGPYLTMLSLAQQTRDPRLARRAAEMALSPPSRPTTRWPRCACGAGSIPNPTKRPSISSAWWSRPTRSPSSSPCSKSACAKRRPPGAAS